jgi:signal peptidase I
MSATPVRRADDDTQPIPVIPARGRHAAPRSGRSFLGWMGLLGREALVVLLVAVAALILIRVLPGQLAYVADDAMEPTLTSGDRVIVSSLTAPGAGDVVLVRAPETWATPGGLAVVRVAAVAGQRVACCDEAGRITVDGLPVDEPYLTGATDQVEFDVTVPDGRIFVLADRREAARDSRAMIDETAGALPLDDVVGRVVFVVWPPRGQLD